MATLIKLMEDYTLPELIIIRSGVQVFIEKYDFYLADYVELRNRLDKSIETGFKLLINQI